MGSLLYTVRRHKLIFNLSAFSSFPDTTLFDTGTQTHSFKIRLSNPLRSVAENSVREYDTLYGYASFMQRKDPSSKRGYLQVRSYLRYRYPD